MYKQQLSFIFWILGLAPCFAQTDTSETIKPTIFQHLFQDSSITQMVITTDLVHLIRHKFTEGYIPARLEFKTEELREDWNIKVAPRGKSRKKICEMPPLRLKFSKKDLKKQGFKNYNKLKLVTYCRDKKKYEYYVLREYLAYQLYNILTDFSYRTQLVKVIYQDSLQRVKPLVYHGFILENTDEMANRLNSREIKKFECTRDSVRSFHYDVFAMFQYMIGNTDWKLELLHNVKAVKHRINGEYVPIGYDFDYSGLVDTEYATPNPDHYQANIRQRIFLGDINDCETLQPSIDLFLQKKEALLQCCADADYLTAKQRKSVIKYLNEFFKQLENPKKLRRRLKRR